MIPQQFVETGKDPLHDGEFLAQRSVPGFDIISFGMQDIKIIVIKIFDVQLGLRLPPDMVSHQVNSENMQVHESAQNKSESEKIDKPYA
jgi:hypothetical protein